MDSDEIIKLKNKVSQKKLELEEKKKESTHSAKELGKIEDKFEQVDMSNLMMSGKMILDEFKENFLVDSPTEYYTFSDELKSFFKKSDDEVVSIAQAINDEVKLTVDEAIEKLDVLNDDFNTMSYVLNCTYQTYSKLSQKVPYIFHRMDETDKKLIEILRSELCKKYKLQSKQLNAN